MKKLIQFAFCLAAVNVAADPVSDALLNSLTNTNFTTNNQIRFTASLTNPPLGQVTNVIISGNEMRLLSGVERYGDIRIGIAEEGKTNLVNTLVESGEFCRVRGHVWGQHFDMTLLHNPNRGSSRECAVCKTVQERTMGDWK